MLVAVIALSISLVASIVSNGYIVYRFVCHLATLEELALMDQKERREYLGSAVKRLDVVTEQQFAIKREQQEDQFDSFGGNRRLG